MKFVQGDHMDKAAAAAGRSYRDAMEKAAAEVLGGGDFQGEREQRRE